MNKVVCVSVPPAYQRPEDRYVERLYNAVKRNTTKPFEFEVRRESDYHGWWAKIELFPPKERIVYLDLDTLIVGNIDFLFEYDGPFAILRDFYHKDGYGSAVMSISPGYGGHIVEALREGRHQINSYWGDQDLIRSCVDNADLWQQLYPGKIVSFKAWDCEDNGIPEGASIICYHGQPKQPETLHLDWVRQNWV